MAGERVLAVKHIAMFRNRPVTFLVWPLLVPGAWLVVRALGQEPWHWVLSGALAAWWLVWWWSSRAATLTVTTRRTSWRHGILSRHTREIRHEDVRLIEVRQVIMDRVFGVGTVVVASAGTADAEIEAPGIAAPRRIRDLIDRCRDPEARRELEADGQRRH